MIEKEFGSAKIKADYVEGKLAIKVVYEKELIGAELGITADAKELVAALLQPLVESTETKLDDQAVAFILEKL